MTDKGFFQVWRRSLYEAAAVKCIFSLEGPQSLTDCCALHLCDSFKSRGQSTEPSFRVVVFYLSRLVFGVSRTTGQQTRIVLCWYLGHTKCYNKGCLGLPQQDHVTPSFKAFRSLWKKKTIYISINQGRAALFQDCRPHQNPFIVTCALTWTQTAALSVPANIYLGLKATNSHHDVPHTIPVSFFFILWIWVTCFERLRTALHFVSSERLWFPSTKKHSPWREKNNNNIVTQKKSNFASIEKKKNIEH